MWFFFSLIVAFAWKHFSWCSKKEKKKSPTAVKEEKKKIVLPCVPDCLCIPHCYNTQQPAKHGGAARSDLAKCRTGWHRGIWRRFVLCHLDWCSWLKGCLCLVLPSELTEVPTSPQHLKNVSLESGVGRRWSLVGYTKTLKGGGGGGVPRALVREGQILKSFSCNGSTLWRNC